jgi:isoleucyl-tRNA synthetase
VMDQLFHCLTTWWAPVLAFTMDEVWLARFPGEGSSVHLMQFATCPEEWAAPDLAAKWDGVRAVRSVITGALEIERQVKKTIGSALEAAPEVYVSNLELLPALGGVDLAEISITSGATLMQGEGPADAFRLDSVKGVAVVFKPAEGRKCARSWKIAPEVGSDPDFPDITPRDAEAVREWQMRFGKTV